MELKNSKTTQLGKNKFALDAFIGAVLMSEDGQNWQGIKPNLVRDTDGWHIEGAPYYAEVKDDGTRLFCPDRNERSRFLRLSNTTLLAPLTKDVISVPAKLDGQVLDSNIVMPALWGEIRFIFTNTGMKFEVLFEEAPPKEVLDDRFLFDHDTAGLDLNQLLSSQQGLGIPRPRLIDANDEERWLDWSLKNGQLELGFDMTGLKFPILLKNTTVDEQVGASTDDCHTYSTQIELGASYLHLDTSWIDVHTYARFQTVTVPNAATIDHAYLDLQSYSNYTGSSNLRIYGIDEDDTATFSTQADADGRDVTTAYKDWTPGNWTINDWYGYTNDPQDIKDPVQEIVNRGGWSSGNDLALKVVNTSQSITRRAQSYDIASSAAPKFHIEYTAGGGGASAKRGWWSK